MPEVRVSPPRVFPEAEHAPRPPAGAAGSADAHRQTAFVLGESTDHVLAGLCLEAAAAREAAGSRYRNVTVAAVLATGSRAWLARLQALHAVEWGGYTAAVALIAAAAEQEAACAALLADGAEAWRDWLAADGLRDLPAEHATQIALTPPPSVDDGDLPALLAEVRGAAGALASPSAGASLLLAGGESGSGRLAVTFGDRDFHMGLAELASGWLLALGLAKSELLLAAEGVLPLPDPEVLRTWRSRARRLLAATRRCRMERRELGGVERYVVENWRRAPSGAVRRIAL